MRHGSNYAVHNRGPPCTAMQIQKGKARPRLPSSPKPITKRLAQKVKGSNLRCDPTVRALLKIRRDCSHPISAKSL